MNEFKHYHPIVGFVYFVLVIGFSMFLLHPLSLAISFLGSFTYSAVQKGKKAIKTNLIYMLPMIIFTALLNPVFSHEGITHLLYLPSGNPLTLESIIYGFCAAIMFVSVICWFSCYNEVMTSDKFLWLFGKIIPALSLIISMVLRFVPKFINQLKIVRNASRCMGGGAHSKSLIKRAKYGISILSVMVTWSLENAIETADSMKARGYGIPGRTTYSIFTFDKRDKTALLCIVFLGIYTFIGSLMGGISFSYFPALKAANLSPLGISVFLSYFLLCIYPVIIEIWEVKKWNALKSKI